MVRKFGQALAAAVIIVGVSSIAGAGANGGGRGDQNVCGSSGIGDVQSITDILIVCPHFRLMSKICGCE